MPLNDGIGIIDGYPNNVGFAYLFKLRLRNLEPFQCRKHACALNVDLRRFASASPPSPSRKPFDLTCAQGGSDVAQLIEGCLGLLDYLTGFCLKATRSSFKTLKRIHIANQSGQTRPSQSDQQMGPIPLGRNK